MTRRSHHHRHLDFHLDPSGAGGMRLTVHSAEVLRGVLEGALGRGTAGAGYPCLGSVDLAAPLAGALVLALDDLPTGPEGETDPPAPTARARRLAMTERLEAFFARNRGNPLVGNGVVVDPGSERGKRLVAQIRAGQAEPKLLADWVRLRIEWRQILDGV